MSISDSQDDDEVRDFIGHLPRLMTFDDMTRECVEKFGPERAWSRSKIVRYWQSDRTKEKGYRNCIEGDKELRSFIEERLGRLTLDEIALECLKQFGEGRAPSRSSIHRHWGRVRRQR